MTKSNSIKRQDQFHEDYLQLQRYIDNLADVPQDLSLEQIKEALRDRIPYLSRRENYGSRATRESGTDALLDQMNALLLSQCIETLEGEANGE